VKESNNFQDLREKWNALLKNNLFGDNVFLTWEWLSIWWRHFREGRKPLVLLVKDEREILAIAPLMLSKYKLPGFGTIKKVEFLGVRHSDYNNFIIIKRVAECMRLIMDYLVDTITDWDWIELKEIPETAENANYLETIFSYSPSNLKLKKRVCNLCPYISLPNSFDLLMKGLSKNMRQNLNKYLRKFSEKHRVELKRYDEAGFSVKEAMELFIKLNEKRWESEGLPGSFKSKEPSFRHFHMDVAELFADKGWLGLYFLTADDEPVSAQYTFEYGQKMFYYLAGFDPQYSNYSVGNLIIRFLLERCIQKGFKEYDMMRGDEPYKLLWTRTVRRNFEIKFVRGTCHSRFFDWMLSNETVNHLAEKLKLSLKKVTYDPNVSLS
jgi:CelD/BcsL family acetyltransferase involved in cellulose biosynthesis